MRIAAVLLAAGRSTRFGAGDKLAAMLDGRPLLDHVAEQLRGLDLAMRFVVRPIGGGDIEGFVTVPVARADAGQGHSLAVGTRAARAAGAEAILVALGDMPYVTGGHHRALIAAAGGPDSLVASTEGAHPSPPALIGARWFSELERLTEDAGARPFLRRALLVRAPADTLRDIDEPGDLPEA